MSLRQDDLAASISIDPENPWLGLSSYTEETRAYFHGRDEEAAELARRVQRKNLTVLFGQSGLGKTSLLRAGLVPRLRGEGFCPVYVRVDYAPESPPPSEQIKQAIFRATAAAGHWTRPGTAIEGESLWEFLHHRGDLLRDVERPHADAAPDLRSVRGDLHACAGRRRGATPRKGVPRGSRRPRREPSAGGARGAPRR